MMGSTHVNLLIGALMVLAAGLAVTLKPTHRLADQGPDIDLERVVPSQIGDWRMVEELDRLMISPDVQAKLDKLYSQTLTRTYAKTSGERVMLSIAYGRDQRDALQLHMPEVCYPSQGFHVDRQVTGSLRLGEAGMPVVRMVATQGPRIEPITYWITLGRHVVTSGTQRKLAQLRYGLGGTVPDGMLVRLSSIGPDVGHAYRMHEDFAAQLHRAVPPEFLSRIFGARDAAAADVMSRHEATPLLAARPPLKGGRARVTAMRN